MKTTTKNSLLFLIAVLVVASGAAMFFMDMTSVEIDGEPINDLLGFGLALLGVTVAVIVTFFVLSLTGLLLAGVAIFLVLLVIFILAVLALALSPLLLPFVILAGLLMFFSKRKTAKSLV